MAGVSEMSSSSASYDAAKVRSELAANAIRDQNSRERQVAHLLNEAQESQDYDRRESRKIPGLGEAVDISV